MLNIYEYIHDGTGSVAVSYLVARTQPLAGGANVEESSRIIRMVHAVATLDDARAWIRDHINGAMLRHTAGDYTVREQAHSQAILCVTAESQP